MEHILQFGVTIDDDAIQKRVMQNASKAITADIREQLFYFHYGNPSSMKSEVAEMVKSVLEESKDEIIRLAAHEVAETMKRSKKYKEIMKAIEETVNESIS
jgi:hypothetical protein